MIKEVAVQIPAPTHCILSCLWARHWRSKCSQWGWAAPCTSAATLLVKNGCVNEWLRGRSGYHDYIGAVYLPIKLTILFNWLFNLDSLSCKKWTSCAAISYQLSAKQQTTPARKQVMLHLLTVLVSPSCFESFTFLPHVIRAFSSLPLTFQPASHLHTVSRKTCLSAATEALMHPEPCD